MYNESQACPSFCHSLARIYLESKLSCAFEKRLYSAAFHLSRVGALRMHVRLKAEQQGGCSTPTGPLDSRAQTHAQRILCRSPAASSRYRPKYSELISGERGWRRTGSYHTPNSLARSRHFHFAPISCLLLLTEYDRLSWSISISGSKWSRAGLGGLGSWQRADPVT